jgi:hypothetical protein
MNEERKAELAAYQKEYHKEYSKKRKAEREKNKVVLSEEEKEQHRQKRKIELAAYRREYQQKNKEILTKKKREYRVEKRKNDPLTKARLNLKCRTAAAFKKGFSKSKKTRELIGCSWDEFKTHIEGLFTEGMSWDNHGFYGWHIDHIIPLASAKTQEDLELLCHYTNLQPLWAQDNLKKGDSLPD